MIWTLLCLSALCHSVYICAIIYDTTLFNIYDMSVGSFLYWCVMRLASQRFFIHSCICLRILIKSYLATFLGTNSLHVLMCRKAVNQSINQSINQSMTWTVLCLSAHYHSVVSVLCSYDMNLAVFVSSNATQFISVLLYLWYNTV